MKCLSPSAQAVLDACDQAFDQCGTTAQGLAAALRAAADQVVPAEAENRVDLRSLDDIDKWNRWSEHMRIRRQFLAIAAELEAHS